MSTQQESAAKPDAFKARMAEARREGRPELANQSRGRQLSHPEQQFADALMAVYAEGASGEAAIAAALAGRGVCRPSSGKADWTAQNLADELQALNADLDAAYALDGFGA